MPSLFPLPEQGDQRIVRISQYTVEAVIRSQTVAVIVDVQGDQAVGGAGELLGVSGRGRGRC